LNFYSTARQLAKLLHAGAIAYGTAAVLLMLLL
jgi:hypothetical protein